MIYPTRYEKLDSLLMGALGMEKLAETSHRKGKKDLERTERETAKTLRAIYVEILQREIITNGETQ
jgi:hypothetical protein